MACCAGERVERSHRRQPVAAARVPQASRGVAARKVAVDVQLTELGTVSIIHARAEQAALGTASWSRTTRSRPATGVGTAKRGGREVKLTTTRWHHDVAGNLLQDARGASERKLPDTRSSMRITVAGPQSIS